MRLLIAPFLVLLGGTPVFAKTPCEGGPRDQWLTADAAAERVSGLGHDTEGLKRVIEGGRLEAKLRHAGRRIETFIEPITGDVVRVGNA